MSSRVIIFGMLFLFSNIGTAFSQNPVQYFYIPLPEAQVQASLKKIYSSTGSEMQSVISMAVTGNNTIVYYDHWEDGYENDLAHPLQASTLIWGDGNPSNGIAPGFANDSLKAGDVITLEGLVSLPRSPGVIKFDGRDKVGVTKAVAITRAEWAKSPGTVLAGAVEVYSVRDFGIAFKSPIGEGLSAASNEMFEYVSMLVMASENGTTMSVDKDGPGGAAAVVVALNEGEAYQVNGGIQVGATLTSNKPVQAHLITGDIGSRYESRWFTLYPTEQWSASYFSPVGTADDGDAAFVFVYNPNGGAITISYETKVGSGTFSVSAGQTVKYQMPKNSGAHFSSSNGEPFFALEAVGANPSSNLVHDWGFSLVPEDNLTPALVLGWGPSSDPTQTLQNGSPVWVTATGDTTVYVDYNGDRAGPNLDPNDEAYDVAVTVGFLESVKIFEPDKDQTGMRLWTTDGTLITAAWGQDPATAGSGNPFLDMGTTVLPFPVPSVKKSHSVVLDVNGDGVINVGETIRYNVKVSNDGVVVLGGVIVLDNLPASVAYVPGSSTFNGLSVADDATGTAFPFDDAGYVIASIPPKGSSIITYDAVVNPGATSVFNSVSVNNNGTPLEDSNEVPIYPDGNATSCADFFFTNAGFTPVIYKAGDGIYLTIRDADKNTNSGSLQTVLVNVTNNTNGDIETVTLTETGNATGIFRSTAALPSSTTVGQAEQDGILFVSAGNQLQADYVDTVYPESCSINTVIAVPTNTKTLYLTGNGGTLADGLDRVDPGAAPDASTATSSSLTAGGNMSGVLPISTPTSVTGDADANPAAPWGSDGVTSLVLNFNTTGQVPSGATITSTQVTVSGATVGRSYVGEIDMQLDLPSGANTTWDFGSNLGQPSSSGTYTNVNAFSAVGAGTTAIGNFALTFTEDYNDTGTDQNVSAVTITINYTSPTSAAPAVYTQSLVMQDAFVIPAGGAVSVTTYVETAAALSSGSGMIAVSGSAASSNAARTASTHSFGYDSGSTGSDRILMVGISYRNSDSETITAVTYGGVSLGTPVGIADSNGGGTPDGISYIYKMLNPPTGTNTLAVTWSSALNEGAVVGAVTYSGVDQTTPTGTFASSSGTAGSISVTVPSLVGDLVFGVVGGRTAINYAAGGDVLWTQRPFSGQTAGAGQSLAGAATSVNLTWTGTNGEEWGAGGIALKPAPGGGGGNLSLPSTLTLSHVGAGGATIVSMTDPTVTDLGSNIYQLDYTATTGAEANISTGNQVKLEVETDGITFDLLYDSDTYPSHIDLGTTTVIAIPALAVYDAPYPGGAVVTDANNGATLYVRATVTDPFGFADITALNLTINDPVSGLGAPISVTNVVSATGKTKIYEYVWATNSHEGNFGLNATATEGYEAVPVTASRSTSVRVTPLDLGTPGVVEFTDASGNVLVDSYDPDDTVYVRVTDFDQAGRPEPITVIVTSSNGDSVTVTLTETAPGSGIFKGSMPSTNTGSPTLGDGTLQAPAGVTLSASYTDPNDPTDFDTDQSIITVPGGGKAVSVAKSLLSPSGGSAQLGESVVYQIIVTNSGTGTLNVVSVSDDYPAGLTFVTSSQAGFSNAGGIVSWANVGPLAQGASKNFTVTFTASAAGANQTNSVTVGGDVSAGPASIPVTVNGPASLSISKTLTGGSPNPAYIGEQVSYDIVITNTGATNVTSIPLTDNYSSNLAFSSATVAATASGGGVVYWANVGPITTSDPPLTITVTFDVVGVGNPVTNGAVIDFATDINGSDVPPVDDSDSSLITQGASIGDYIWNDLDGDGIQDANEAGIAGVTVYIDTNNNGVRDPDEKFDVTDAGGAYELGNLAPGKYAVRVAASTLPVGTSQTGDPDASFDNATTVTLAAGQTFTDADFGYQGGTGAIFGQVRNDIDGNGNLSDPDSGLKGITVSLYADQNGNGTVDAGDTLLTSAITDNNGNYGFTGLGSGNYIVVETDPNGASSTNDRNNDPLGSAGIDNKIAITLLDTATSNNNDFLDTNVGSNLISGSVINDANGNGSDDSEPGIPGVTVQLFIDGGTTPGVYDAGDTLSETTVTVGSGGYEFTNVPDGNYVVVETDPARATSTGDLTGSPTDNNIAVTVGSGNPSATGNDFLDTGASLASISGIVFNDADKSGTFSAPDTRLVGVTVNLYQDTNNNGAADPGEPLVGSTTTGSVGEYSFAGLPDGDYVVVEIDPPNTGSVIDIDGTTNNNNNEIGVALAGTNSSGNNFLDASASVSGQVRHDTDGNGNLGDSDTGVGGVTISLYKDVNDNGVYNPGTDTLIGTTTTDASGNYIFTGIGDGSYVVVETDPAGSTSTNDKSNAPLGALGIDNTVPVQISGASNSSGNDFLDTGVTTYTVAGQVTDGANPIPGVTVVIKDASGNVIGTAITNSNDDYSFPNLVAGNYSVTETDPAGTTGGSDKDSADNDNIITITGLAADSLDNDFVDTGATLAGIAGSVFNDGPLGLDIFDGDDTPIAGVKVSLYQDTNSNGLLDPGEPLLGITYTSGNGSYSFSNLPVGNYVVVETDPPGAVSENDTDGVPTDNNVGVVLTGAGDSTGNDFLDGGALTSEISGQVTDGSNQPIPGVTITLKNGAGDVIDTTVTDLSGNYDFPNLPGGPYIVEETNPSGTTGGSDVDGPGNGDDVIAVTLVGGVPSPDNDFVDLGSAVYKLSGTVYEDNDISNDNLFGLDDSPMGGVEIELWADTNGDGNPDVRLGSTVSATNGSYEFEGLPDGNYVIIELDPSGGVSDNDTQGGASDNSISTAISGADSSGNDFLDDALALASITGQVRNDINGNGNPADPDEPVEGVKVTIYTDPNGDGNPDDGVAFDTMTTDASGGYTFPNLPPDDYVVVETDPSGATSTYDTDGGPTDNTIGVVLNGINSTGNDFLDKLQKVPTFADWQTANPLGGNNGPTDNPDGDIYDNALEYAFCLKPEDGSTITVPGGQGGFCALVNNTSGEVDAFYVRPEDGAADLSYTLQTATAPGNPTTWTDRTDLTPTITVNGDGTETVRYPDLEAAVGSSGLVRVCVEITGDLTGPHYTQVWGWNGEVLPASCQTWSNPYAPKGFYSGTATNGDYALGVLTSTAGGDVSALLGSGEYYIEMIGGTYEGHRFDLNEGAATATGIAIDTSSAHNTLSTVPATLAGAYELRKHTTLDAILPTSLFTPNNNSGLGDRLLLFANGAWQVVWVYDQSGGIPAQWTDSGNSSLDDVGDVIVEPCQGLFTHPRAAAVGMVTVGVVRSWDFACPLNTGYNLVGGGYPQDMSPEDRVMLRDASDGVAQDYFTSNANPILADQLLHWLGDDVVGVEGYRTYYNLYLPSTVYDYWTDQTNSNLTNENASDLFGYQRATFYDMISGHDRSNPAEVWVWPAPWTP